MATIFWVEDQSHWIERFKPILEKTNFDGSRPETANTGASASSGSCEKAALNHVITHRLANAARQQITLTPDEQKPDIAILDAHMNGNAGAGFSVSRALLAKWPKLPIIYLSEHSGTQTEKTALEEMYAQDFIAKHQHNIEEVLCWRIKAILRQNSNHKQSREDMLCSDNLSIDLTTWDVYWHTKKLMNPTNPRRPLAPMPRKILYQLVQCSPRPVTTHQIVDNLQADPEKFSYANYRQHIKTLRHSFDMAEGGKGSFLERCKSGTGIVTFGDLGAYCWKP